MKIALVKEFNLRPDESGHFNGREMALKEKMRPHVEPLISGRVKRKSRRYDWLNVLLVLIRDRHDVLPPSYV
jgi:hypothetical protein